MPEVQWNVVDELAWSRKSSGPPVVETEQIGEPLVAHDLAVCRGHPISGRREEDQVLAALVVPLSVMMADVVVDGAGQRSGSEEVPGSLYLTNVTADTIVR